MASLIKLSPVDGKSVTKRVSGISEIAALHKNRKVVGSVVTFNNGETLEVKETPKAIRELANS